MKTQKRGNCQCCGRQQAITGGKMAKHGYTVKHGWFEGVCPGNRYEPMQVERTITDKIVVDIRAEVVDLRARVQGLKDGKVFPKNVLGDRAMVEGKWKQVELPFAEGTDYQKEDAVKAAIWAAERRISVGESFAKDMEELANRVHGTPIIVVKVEDAPAPILSGQQKTLGNGMTATVDYQEGGRVWFKYNHPSSGKEVSSWMGVQSWRKL